MTRIQPPTATCGAYSTPLHILILHQSINQSLLNLYYLYIIVSKFVGVLLNNDHNHHKNQLAPSDY